MFRVGDIVQYRPTDESRVFFGNIAAVNNEARTIDVRYFDDKLGLNTLVTHISMDNQVAAELSSALAPGQFCKFT